MHLFAQFRRTLPKGFMGFSAVAARGIHSFLRYRRGETQTGWKPLRVVISTLNHLHVKYKLLPIPVTRKPLENYQWLGFEIFSKPLTGPCPPLLKPRRSAHFVARTFAEIIGAPIKYWPASTVRPSVKRGWQWGAAAECNGPPNQFEESSLCLKMAILRIQINRLKERSYKTGQSKDISKDLSWRLISCFLSMKYCNHPVSKHIRIIIISIIYLRMS